MSIRRVVTGLDQAGKSVVKSDAPVEGITLELLPGYEWHKLWAVNGGAKLPEDDQSQLPLPTFPDAGGFRFGLLTIAPDSIGMSEDIDVAGALEELETKLPGTTAYSDPDNPGMHASPTVDFDYILSGRLVLELDDGARVELGPGDSLIQNGPRHLWSNPFEEPCQ